MITLLTALVGAGLGVWNLLKGILDTRPYVTLGPTTDGDLMTILATIHNPSRRALQIVHLTRSGSLGEIIVHPDRPEGSPLHDLRDAWTAAEGGLSIYVPPGGTRVLRIARIQPRDDARFWLHWHRHDWRERMIGQRWMQMRFRIAGQMMEQIIA